MVTCEVVELAICLALSERGIPLCVFGDVSISIYLFDWSSLVILLVVISDC